MKRRFFRYLILSLYLCLVFYCVCNPRLINCLMIDFSSLEKIRHNVYVSEGTSNSEKDSLLKLLNKSNQRVKNLWGSVESDPVFIICSTFDDYIDYGMYKVDGLACMYPFGTYIIISPDGINENIISHEICHAELYSRIGFSDDDEIPLWFHEGLASLVSHYQPNSYDGFKQVWNKRSKNGRVKIDLNDISSYDGFYGSPAIMDLPYWRAALEVSRWYEITGKEGLLELVSLIKNGQDFKSSYKLVEEKNSPGN